MGLICGFFIKWVIFYVLLWKTNTLVTDFIGKEQDIV